MEVVPIPVLQDNYSYLIIDPASRDAAIVDCAEAEPVLAEARRRSVTLTAILATHHHWDHIGGNEALLSALPSLRVYGSARDRERIPGLTHGLEEGDTLAIGGLRATAIFIPAHTSGHLAYHFTAQRAVFTGDTLFAGGCGRLFEGDAAQMMASLAKLAVLPPETRVYCGHEYTEKNLLFAATLEPGNRALAEKLASVRRLRADGMPSVPSTIASERATNPFLRVDSPELRATLRARFPDLEDDPVAVFAKTRALKDQF
jgi:hydroxyacylglutathione hydrolase